MAIFSVDDEGAQELQYMLDAQAEFSKELVLMAYHKLLWTVTFWDYDRLSSHDQ